VVVGAVQLAASTALFTGYASYEFPFEFGSIPLSLGAGFVTLGALLMHFGERREWAAADAQSNRAPPGPNVPPQPFTDLRPLGWAGQHGAGFGLAGRF
jgi:hypothetical protein